MCDSRCLNGDETTFSVADARGNYGTVSLSIVWQWNQWTLGPPFTESCVLGSVDFRLRQLASVDQGMRQLSPEPNPCSVMPSAEFIRARMFSTPI